MRLLFVRDPDSFGRITKNLRPRRSRIKREKLIMDEVITPSPSEGGGSAPEPATVPPVVAGEPSAGDIDYKAELEKAEKELKEAQHNIIELRLKNKELREGGGEPPSPSEPPAMEIEERIQQAVQQAVQPLQTELFRTRASDVAATLAGSEDERKLILLHWENTITRSGDLLKDLKRAQLIANESRLDKDLDELRASALSRQTRSAGAGSPGQKPPSLEENYALQLTPDEMDLARRTAQSVNKPVEGIIKKMAEAKRGG